MNSIVEVENLADLYDTAPCGYVSFLTDGLVIKINQTMLNWLGLERVDVVSKMRFQDFLSVGEQIFFETQVSPLLQMQGEAPEINFNLMTKSREKIPVLTSAKQFEVSEEKVPVNRMTVFNISDRKKFESELVLERKKAELAAKSKTDFLAMLSHEIRTPPNAVIGVSNLLESTTLSSEQAPFMEMLKNSSDNLLNMLNSILDLSKIESGNISVESKQFPLRKFVEGNILAWQGLAQKKGIEVRAEVDSSIPDSAIGDPVKITQILSNLIGNAVKFTSVGSVILKAKLLSFDKVEMKIRFEIHDTGIGIASAKLTTIFEEFNQAEYETSTQFGGTGLGLTISQKLAVLMGARIHVDSKLGEGSCFSFELVLPAGDPKPKHTASSASAIKQIRSSDSTCSSPMIAKTTLC